MSSAYLLVSTPTWMKRLLSCSLEHPPRGDHRFLLVSTFNIRLTREGTAEPLSRDQILRRARGQGNVHFPCSADHELDWQPYPVDPYSAICDDHTYIHTYIHPPGFVKLVSHSFQSVHPPSYRDFKDQTVHPPSYDESKVQTMHPPR